MRTKTQSIAKSIMFHLKKLKNQVTVNIDAENADYFKALAEKTGIPYTKLINLYLADCVKNKRQLAWV